MAGVLLALLFAPALVAIAVLALRWRRPRHVRIVAAAAPVLTTISGEADPVAAIDSLLEELERTTMRLEGEGDLDARSVAELEQLADRLDAAAAELERIA